MGGGGGGAGPWWGSEGGQGPGKNFQKHFHIFFSIKNLFFWGLFSFFGTRSQPRSVSEVNPEVNPEAGGTGIMPLAVTQEDCLVA